jgi:hypothetical protein
MTKLCAAALTFIVAYSLPQESGYIDSKPPTEMFSLPPLTSQPAGVDDRVLMLELESKIQGLEIEILKERLDLLERLRIELTQKKRLRC